MPLADSVMMAKKFKGKNLQNTFIQLPFPTCKFTFQSKISDSKALRFFFFFVLFLNEGVSTRVSSRSQDSRHMVLLGYTYLYCGARFQRDKWGAGA